MPSVRGARCRTSAFSFNETVKLNLEMISILGGRCYVNLPLMIQVGHRSKKWNTEVCERTKREDGWKYDRGRDPGLLQQLINRELDDSEVERKTNIWPARISRSVCTSIVEGCTNIQELEGV